MIMEVNGLCKTYAKKSGRDAKDTENGITVLRNLDFAAGHPNRSETVAIIGPSGSGKSTLLAMLAGLDAPTSGTIRVAGQDLSKLDQAGLSRFRAKNLGIVFQQFHLMSSLTALENVRLPLEIAEIADATAIATSMLSSVGLGHRLQHFPAELSGGECQRVAIARALAVDPAIYLADEPSGNLDQKTGIQIMELLFERIKSKKSTLILVTHNEELAKWCDRRLILQEGRLHTLE